MKRFGFVLLLALHSFAHASEISKSECSPVDYSGDLGPIRDQGNIGWCYGYAATDLLSFQLKQRISAPAVIFSKSGIQLFRKGLAATDSGNIRPILKRALREGLCLNSRFPYEGNDAIQKYKTDAANFKTSINQQCGERIFPTFSIEQERIRDTQKIDRQLNQNNIVAADIDGRIFDITKSELVKSDPSFYFHPDHVTLIVGRRWNEKKDRCEYLIRNAYGEDCNAYRRKDLDCDKGYIWLSDNDLASSVNRITYLTQDSN